LAGLADFNDQQVAEGLQQICLGRYLTSAEFAVNTAENWPSEYLQFFLFIMLRVWLVQKGSPGSKKVEQIGLESDKDQRVGPHAPADSPAWARAAGWRRVLLSNSLGLVIGTVSCCRGWPSR
jgi:hypothetical protein